VPVPYGGIDVKSMDGDFYSRIGGKAISEVAANFAVRAPLTQKDRAVFDEFKKNSANYPFTQLSSL
jgi:branched-chain amino acid transport system substrate-binding protein